MFVTVIMREPLFRFAFNTRPKVAMTCREARLVLGIARSLRGGDCSNRMLVSTALAKALQGQPSQAIVLHGYLHPLGYALHSPKHFTLFRPAK